MRAFHKLLICVLVTVGCVSEKRKPWHTESLDLRDIDSITLVLSARFLDGGTTILYAFTDSGEKCAIRLNPLALLGEYRLDETESPGRLVFNDRLVDVRSVDEQILLRLLKRAAFTPIDPDGLQKLEAVAKVQRADLHSVAADHSDQEIRDHRDLIVAYVESESYVDVATNGLPLPQ